MPQAKRSKKTAITVDFKGVEAGKGRPVPDGDYLCEVDEVTLETSQESGQDYLRWVFKIVDGKCKGSRIWDNTSLQTQALWKLRQLLEALGVDVPEGPLELETEEYIGLPATLTVQNEKYQGKDYPRVVAYAPADSLEEEEEEETEEDEEDEEEASIEDEEEKPIARSAKRKKVEKPEIKVGMKVKFEDDGEEMVGKVLKIEKDVALVKVKKEEWEINLDDLTEA